MQFGSPSPQSPISGGTDDELSDGAWRFKSSFPTEMRKDFRMFVWDGFENCHSKIDPAEYTKTMSWEADSRSPPNELAWPWDECMEFYGRGHQGLLPLDSTTFHRTFIGLFWEMGVRHGDFGHQDWSAERTMWDPTLEGTIGHPRREVSGWFSFSKFISHHVLPSLIRAWV